jgi:ATP phosphoribosyltransferase
VSDLLTIALAKGRILDATLPLLARAGIEPVDDLSKSRKLVFATNHPAINLVLIRSADLYERVDLKIATCKMMTAGFPDRPLPRTRLKVATKYPQITRRFFLERGRQVELIKLYGSMELAPVVGLADIIVDLVDSGNTLKANGLAPMETIMDISSRLIVNRAALKMKNEAVKALVEQIENAVE